MHFSRHSRFLIFVYLILREYGNCDYLPSKPFMEMVTHGDAGAGSTIPASLGAPCEATSSM